MITNSKAYIPFAAVALIAGILGWGVSAYSNRQTAEAMPNAVQPLALNSNDQQAVMNPNGQLVTVQPLQPGQVAYALQPVAVTPAVIGAPGAQPIIVNNQLPAQQAPVVVRNTRTSSNVGTATVRKKGMSNKAKTAIAIGAGAGVGAAIGGIAKGGKGAAIGALAGGGAGAIYSLIKHKKGQPVF